MGARAGCAIARWPALGFQRMRIHSHLNDTHVRTSRKQAKPSFPLLFGERDRPVHFLPVGKAVL